MGDQASGIYVHGAVVTENPVHGGLIPTHGKGIGPTHGTNGEGEGAEPDPVQVGHPGGSIVSAGGANTGFIIGTVYDVPEDCTIEELYVYGDGAYAHATAPYRLVAYDCVAYVNNNSVTLGAKLAELTMEGIVANGLNGGAVTPFNLDAGAKKVFLAVHCGHVGLAWGRVAALISHSIADNYADGSPASLGSAGNGNINGTAMLAVGVARS